MDFSNLEGLSRRLGNIGFLLDSSLGDELFILNLYTHALIDEASKELITNNVNRNDYIEYIISQVGPPDYLEAVDILLIKKWLDEYETSIEDILTNKCSNIQFRKILNSNYKTFSESMDENFIYLSIQQDFYIFFSKYFANKLIEFLESKKTTSNSDLMINFDTGKTEKIKWIGKPSQLGFIIRQLVDMGYIEAPLRSTGEINYTQFAKRVITTFDVETKEDTLIKYLNFDSEKSQSTIRKFNENGFNLPHKNRIS